MRSPVAPRPNRDATPGSAFQRSALKQGIPSNSRGARGPWRLPHMGGRIYFLFAAPYPQIRSFLPRIYRGSEKLPGLPGVDLIRFETRHLRYGEPPRKLPASYPGAPRAGPSEPPHHPSMKSGSGLWALGGAAGQRRAVVGSPAPRRHRVGDWGALAGAGRWAGPSRSRRARLRPNGSPHPHDALRPPRCPPRGL